MVQKCCEVNQLLDDESPDIFCATETWIKPANKAVVYSQLDTVKYNVFSTERIDKEGGGTMIMVNKNYATKQTPLTPGAITYPSWVKDKIDRVEVTMVQLHPRRLPRGYSCVIVVCFYIPEWARNRQDLAMKQLGQKIEPFAIGCSKPLLIIAGDSNGTNTVSFENAFQLHQVNHLPTRKDNCLDIMLTNAPKCYLSENRPSIGKSDHAVVLNMPTAESYKQTRAPVRKIQVRTGKVEDIATEINNSADWYDILATQYSDLQASFDRLYKVIHEAQEKCQKTVIFKEKDDKPWMNKKIKSLIIKRQELHALGEFDKRKALATRIKKEIWRSKKSYYRKYTNKDTNWCWKEINKTRNPPPPTADDEELPEQLNEYFYSVWNGQNQPDISSFIVKDSEQPDLPIFTTNSIGRALGKLKSSSGPDDVSGKLLKHIAPILSQPLAVLCNACVRSSFIPKQWKDANIVPIPKVSHPKEPSDHRPMALTSNLSKAFERELVKFILEMTKHIWKSNKQYGFLPKRCTMDAIIKVIDDWSNGKDVGDQIFAIFFDFAKAFDLVDHHVLLTKLSKILPPWLISLIAQWLTDRRQRVKINGKTTN